MPRIIPLKFKEVCTKLKKLGYTGPYPGGKHMLMVKGSDVIPVPSHGGKDVSQGVIETIIDHCNISKQERIDL